MIGHVFPNGARQVGQLLMYLHRHTLVSSQALHRSVMVFAVPHAARKGARGLDVRKLASASGPIPLLRCQVHHHKASLQASHEHASRDQVVDEAKLHVGGGVSSGLKY
jgi:hypothetical protein